MDKFNDMWKNRFNDSNMPIADWNTPDDEVWDAILPHVVEEKKRRFIWWLFFVLGGLIILFLMLKTTPNRHLQISSFPVKTLSDVGQTKASSKSDDRISILDEVNENPSNEESNDKNTENIQSNSNEVSIANQLSLDQENLQSSVLIKTNETNKTNKLSDSHIVSRTDYAAENLGEKNDELSKTELVSERNSLAPSDLLPTLQFMLNHQPVSEEMPNVIVEEVKEKKNIKISLAMGAMFWNHSISGAYQNDLAPFDFNYTNNIGSFISTQVSIPISSKWRFFTGLQFEQVTTNSGHNSAIEYNKTLENTTSNNDYNLGLATPYGISAANFVLDRDVDQPIIDDTVPLLVDFHSNHKIKNLNVPIGVQVTPWAKHKAILPSFKLGGGINYITQITNELDAIDTHHGAISFNKDASMDFDAPTIEKLFFDIQVGVKTSVFVSKTLQLEFEYSWKKGLNPIFKQSDYNTTINRHFLSAGLSKTLGK